MRIQKIITLLGDNISLSFFVKENNTYDTELIFMWFKNSDTDEEILGDNYFYYNDEFNKNEIEKDLIKVFPGKVGLYGEMMQLLTKMKEYESHR